MRSARPRNRPRRTSRHSTTRWLGTFLFSKAAHRVADLGRSAKMKTTGLLAILIGLFFSACMHYVSADVVIPSDSKVMAIDIVLSGAPGFSLTNQKKIDSLMSFMRENCGWTMSAVDRVESKEAKERGYRIVVHRSDGSRIDVEVGERTLLMGAYSAKLSAGAAEKLDDLCGLERIHLSPFHAKEPNQSSQRNAMARPISVFESRSSRG